VLSPGNHSKYLAGHFVYPSPRSDTAGFLAELERIVRDHEIDVIVPAFEEAFYISTQIERLSRATKVFASPFRTLARLHDKGVFARLVAQLGLPIPETVVVTSDEELHGQLERLALDLRDRVAQVVGRPVAIAGLRHAGRLAVRRLAVASVAAGGSPAASSHAAGSVV
jgi:predicted ATP-grasp superfamily ATP-dependent carboligase